MINRIMNLLNDNSLINAWMIKIKKTKSAELFFAFDKLEMNRAKEVIEYKVTVYHDFSDFRGDATISVTEYMTNEEIRSKIQDALFRTQYVKNLFYELPKKKEEIEFFKSNMDDDSLTNIAQEIANVINSVKLGSNVSINQTEIFVNEEDIHILNSNGVDYSYTKYSGEIELIPTAVKDNEEFEIHRFLQFGNVDYQEIKAFVEEGIRNVTLRANAKRGININNCKVIFTGKEVQDLFGYFVDELTYRSVYQKMSRFELNKSVLSDDYDGDSFTIRLDPNIKESAESMPFDASGVLLKPVLLIKDGVPKMYHGENRFGYYLKEDNPTGVIGNIVVDKGNTPVMEMKKEPYLECLSFSGLQVDEYTGYCGGEVRLANYFDGENIYPVTGISISGNINEMKNNFTLSEEEQRINGFVGPRFVAVKGMSIY